MAAPLWKQIFKKQLPPVLPFAKGKWQSGFHYLKAICDWRGCEPGMSQNSAGEIVIYEAKFPNPTMVGVVISAKMRRTLIWHDRQWRQRWWRQVRRWQRSFCWVRCNWYFCFGSTWWRLQVWSGIYRYVSSSGFICHANNFLGAKSLGELDLDLLCIYTLKVEDHLSEHTFNRLSKVFPNNNHNTLKMMKKCIQFLSGFQPVQYSCCINSCVCFVGPYEDLTKCPNCQKAWYTAKGKPQKSFNYLPLIPWLRAMLTNSSLAKKMRYQAEHDHEPTVIKDVFDSNHYQSLLHTIVPAEKDHPFFYFSDEHDIALGLSTDGFAPFKQCDKTCWPVEIFNYNLSPEIHFLKNITFLSLQFLVPKSLGIGTHSVGCSFKNSFSWRLVLRLSMPSARHFFLLHAYLILTFGDIPAVALVMHMKGQNGLSPCQTCNIKGISVSRTYYAPLWYDNIPRADPNKHMLWKCPPIIPCMNSLLNNMASKGYLS